MIWFNYSDSGNLTRDSGNSVTNVTWPTLTVPAPPARKQLSPHLLASAGSCAADGGGSHGAGDPRDVGGAGAEQIAYAGPLRVAPRRRLRGVAQRRQCIRLFIRLLFELFDSNKRPRAYRLL